MDLTLIRFAVDKDSKPKYYLLDDKKYDDLVVGEPQEGYYIFETIGWWEISDILLRDGMKTHFLLQEHRDKNGVGYKGDSLGGIINFSHMRD